MPRLALWRWILATLVASVLMPGTGARSQTIDKNWSAPGMYIGVGTHSLHVHCLGSGEPTVVFESGLGGNYLDWVRVQPAVARFTRSCSYDRAGYGWSESGPLPRDAARLSGDLEKLLVYASLPAPYILVAHSFGGLPVRLYANGNPRKLAALVLIDTSHERQFEHDREGSRRPLAPSRRSFVITNIGEIPSGIPLPLRAMAASLAVRPRAVRALYAELADMRRSARQVVDRPWLPDVPIRVVMRTPRPERGLESEERWHAGQRELARRLPNASLHVANDAGHHVQLDEPELVVDLIQALVDEHRNRTLANAASIKEKQ